MTVVGLGGGESCEKAIDMWGKVDATRIACPSCGAPVGVFCRDHTGDGPFTCCERVFLAYRKRVFPCDVR